MKKKQIRPNRVHNRVNETRLPLLLLIIPLLFPLLFPFLSPLPVAAGDQPGNQTGQDPLQYEVSVSARLVPVFAVDQKGEPVHDLQQEDIQLYADGQPVDVIFFNRFQVEENRVDVEETGKKVEKVGSQKSPERINFIIIDSLISNKNTMEPARAVTMGIIKRASPGDAFVILESNQISGFQHVIGPVKDKKQLADALKKMEKRYMRRRTRLARGLPNASEYADPGKLQLDITLHLLHSQKAQREQGNYQRDIRYFSESLKQLKFALKSTTLPKIVYLISAGVSPEGLGKSVGTYYRFMEEAAEAVNYGGAAFYLVNPLKQKSLEGRRGTSLKFMADRVGGRFIKGTSVADIVSRVKKSTAAYYELAFYPQQGNNPKSRIRLKCKRKDVKLVTVTYSEQGTPYHRMSVMQKKLFALNVVNGGSWSRMVGTVREIAHSKGKQNGKNISFSLPPELRNRGVDIFRVSVDPATQKANIAIETQSTGDTGTLEIKPGSQANRDPKHHLKHYVVLIEPTLPYCIFSPV